MVLFFPLAPIPTLRYTSPISKPRPEEPGLGRFAAQRRLFTAARPAQETTLTKREFTPTTEYRYRGLIENCGDSARRS